MPSQTQDSTLGAAIRSEFPIFETATYLNSCSQGALSTTVRDAVEEWLAGWDENGAEWDFWVERNDAFRQTIARLLHAQADDVAVTDPAGHRRVDLVVVQRPGERVVGGGRAARPGVGPRVEGVVVARRVEELARRVERRAVGVDRDAGDVVQHDPARAAYGVVVPVGELAAEEERLRQRPFEQRRAALGEVEADDAPPRE